MILTLFLIAISGAAEITFNRPVVIESNASLSDWAHTGTGTLTDPYIIENLVIKVSGNPYCLFIKNVNKPLVIKNCTFQGASNEALWLENVDTAWIVDCVIENNVGAVKVKGIINKIVFTGNTFRNNNFDVELEAEPGFIAFDDGFVGNYWDIHSHQDANGDGICDTQYVLLGPEGPEEGVVDQYPLVEPLVGHTTSPEGILLYAHYRKGEEFQVRQTGSLRIVKVPGGVAELTMQLALLNRVVSVPGYGVYVVEVTVLEDKGKAQVNGLPAPYESRAGSKTLQRIHRFGTVPEPGYGVSGTELAGVDIGVQFPVRRLKPGDSWTTTWTVGAESLGLEEGEQKLIATYTFSRIEEIHGWQCAVIEAQLSSTGAGVAVEPLTGARVQISTEMTSEVTTYFSLAHGRIIMETGTLRLEQIGIYLGMPILHQTIEMETVQEEILEREGPARSTEEPESQQEGSTEMAPESSEEQDSEDIAEKARQALEQGMELLVQGELERAERLFIYAADLFRQIPNLKGEADALSGAGIAQQHQEKYREAIATLERAAELYHRISDAHDEAACLNNIGLCYRRLGEHEVALTYYERVLALADNDNELRSAALLNIGVCYIGMGQYEKALMSLKKARTFKKLISDKEGEVSVLINIGACYRKLGLYQQALTTYDEAVKISQEISNPVFEASARLNRGNCLRELGLFEQALTELKISRGLWKRAHDSYGEAMAWTLTAVCQLSLSNPTGAWSSLEKALSLCENRDIKGSVAFWRGWVQVALGDFSSAVSYFGQALEWAQAGGDAEAQWRSLWGIGKSLWLTGDLARAEEYYEKAIECIEQIRGVIPETEIQKAYHGTVQDVYKEYLELLLQLEHLSETLWYSERSRARSLLDILSGGSIPNARLVEIGGLVARKAVDVEEIKDLIGQVPGVLQDNEAVLVYGLSTEHLFMWIVTKELGIQGPIVQPCDYDALLLDVYKFRSQLERLEVTTDLGDRLYELLIRPAEGMLEGKDTLIIVPSGPLWYVPFEALQVPGDPFSAPYYLLQRYAIAYAPSLSSLPIILAAEDEQGNERVLAFVNPSRSDMPPIPSNLEATVKEFAEAVGGGEVITGSQATEAALKKLLPLASCDTGSCEVPFRYVVFGCHGVFRCANPLYSYVALGGGEGEDGNFYAREVLERRLSGVKMVLLLACESFLPAVESRIETTTMGLGRDITPQEKVRVMRDLVQGDELVGLSRAFILAGAEAVLATRWELSAPVGGELARHLGEELGKAPTKALALQSAQKKLIEAGTLEPWFWAPFILIGNWR